MSALCDCCGPRHRRSAAFSVMPKLVMVQIDIMILRTVRAGDSHKWIQLVFFERLFALDRGVSRLML